MTNKGILAGGDKPALDVIINERLDPHIPPPKSASHILEYLCTIRDLEFLLDGRIHVRYAVPYCIRHRNTAGGEMQDFL